MDPVVLLRQQVAKLHEEVEKLKEYKIKQEQKHDLHVFWAKKWLKLTAKVVSWAILIAFLLLELKKMDPHL